MMAPSGSGEPAVVGFGYQLASPVGGKLLVQRLIQSLILRNMLS